MKLNNLIIGTANFNNKYGYKKKLFSSNELNEIFNILNKNKINCFDTAQSYGLSEKILGKRSDRKIIFTKINIPNVKTHEIETKTIELFNKSLINLKKKKIEGILIHNANSFIMNKNIQKKIISVLRKFKKEKKIKKIGFSIYTPQELNKITKIFIPDFLQIPLNILDQRFLRDNIISKIKKYKIEIHARSIFLRGKILRNNQFYSSIVNKKVDSFNKWCVINQVDRISACINFIRNYKFISKIIVGIDSKSQLKKIIKVLNNSKYYVPTEFKINNYSLIDPRKI